MKPVIRYTRHNEVPVLNTRAGKVEAHYFNHVQTALKRHGPQIRLRIPGLKHLELILQRDAWIVVDLALHEFPILCWTRFESFHRDNLHEPVKCEVRYFHYASSMIYNRTLDGMEQMLEDMLHKDLPRSSTGVVPLKK